MTGQSYDDNYIANLLAKDAKTAKKTYELVGIDAFSSKRLKSGAPKPNTNFLRNIIRQTDNHNAALLAREAEESNARLKEMNLERLRAQKSEGIRKQKRADGRLTPLLSEEEDVHTRPSRRYADDRNGDGGHGSEPRKRNRSRDSGGRRARSRSRESRYRHEKGETSERRSKHSGHHRDRHSHHERENNDDDDDRSRRKHRSSHTHKRRRSHSESPSSSQSDRANRKRRHRDRSRSRPPPRKSHLSTRRPSHKSRRRSPTPTSDSDPLEAIVGPLPPNTHPSIRSRGRGANKANSTGMDSRFSSTYDPSTDVRQASDAEDDWGEALESFRDRQRWKQQGADRLKAAGFTDAQVKKWEKGDNKDEEDVTWSKRGQAREWDRGKVVGEDGHVELKAEWGRLT